MENTGPALLLSPVQGNQCRPSAAQRLISSESESILEEEVGVPVDAQASNESHEQSNSFQVASESIHLIMDGDGADAQIDDDGESQNNLATLYSAQVK